MDEKVSITQGEEPNTLTLRVRILQDGIDKEELVQCITDAICDYYTEKENRPKE